LQTRWLALPALLIAAYGAGLLYEMVAAPAGCCALTWPSPDPVQAERVLGQTDPQGRNAAAQARTAQAVLAARPGDPTAWLRAAYAERLQHGHLTDTGRRDIDTSYLIAPYGGPWSPWRIAFALDNWTALTPKIRQLVAAEVDVALDDDFVIREATKARALKVQDPRGRLAAALLGITAPSPHAHRAQPLPVG
jgi:hypothetical protein